MAGRKFKTNFTKRIGLKLADALMVANTDTNATEYTDLTDVKALIVTPEIETVNANLVQIESNLEMNKSFIESSTTFTADEITVAKAIKSIKIYNANPSRQYLIRYLCNNDSIYNYNINITDKVTGTEQTKSIATVSNPGGLNFLTLQFTLGTDNPITLKIAIDYSLLSERVYMNKGYAISNFVISKQTYSDVSIEMFEDTQTTLESIIASNTSTLNELFIKQNEITWSIKYWTATGVLSTFGDYGHSSFLRVKPGAEITVSGLGIVAGAAAKVMSFFDASYNWICYSDNFTETVDSDLHANYEEIAYVSFSTSNYITLPLTIVILINNNTEFDNINQRVSLLEATGITTKDKTLAVLGDSIMMLMRTNSVPANIVTFVGTDDITYPNADLTNIGGRLYVTSTLVGGEVVDGTTIECEITNSSQSAYDVQNWDALKNKLSLADLINCGLGGARFRERDYVTAYPYPDGDANTTCITNEVRMLKRLVDSGRTSPDIIMIWAGTNDVGQPSTDNFDEIMSLNWSILSANDNLGWTYRKTFYGGLRFTLEYLYRNFQNATIFVFSPIQAAETLRILADLTITKDAIKRMAERYSCIFCNALNEAGIVNEFEASDGSGYWLYDGLHPNNAGKVLLKNYAHRKITSYFFDKND
ncbi:MAG: SGNH/GDSL hydrolase family protein [Prolixibacteraceae bacterium]